MFHLVMPILVTFSQSIYGWNAMYAAGRVYEMRESAFHALEVKAEKECGERGYDELDPTHYSHAYEGAHFVEHSFVFIRCRSKI